MNKNAQTGILTVPSERDPAEIDGLPPYSFVRVKFPVFAPNENIKDELGLLEVIVVSEAVDPNTGVLVGDD